MQQLAVLLSLQHLLVLCNAFVLYSMISPNFLEPRIKFIFEDVFHGSIFLRCVLSRQHMYSKFRYFNSRMKICNTIIK